MLGQQPSAPPAAVLQAHDERWEALVGEFWGTDSGEALSAVLRRMEEYVLQSAPAVDLSAEILQMAGQKRALDEAAWKHASAAFGGLMRAAGRTPPPTAAMATRPTPGIGPALVTGAPTTFVHVAPSDEGQPFSDADNALIARSQEPDAARPRSSTKRKDLQIPVALRKALIREGHLTEATAASMDTITFQHVGPDGTASPYSPR